MSTDWKEDAIHHKYAPIPEDEPRHKKKAKKRHVRSDHRHEYEKVCIDAHSYVLFHGKRTPYMYEGVRCKVCGRLKDVRTMSDWHEPPESMRLFVVDDFLALFDKYLPDEKEAIQ